ncbi:MAG: hypothetical protein IJJ09_02590, partial [Synergistaceae bacterium]|nr:hypothetical protein [Synergistaceae bacterium]
MGATHEQSGHASRRNSNEQSNLQLDLFDISEEQENIEEVENISPVSNIDNEIKDVKNINSDIKNIENQENINTVENEVQTQNQLRENYRITDDDLGVGGAKTKFKNNVEAIRTLKKIENEYRLATPEEQEILSRYVGWGGISQAFDEKNDDWKKEYAELKELLTEEEYNAARGSTL